MKIFVYIKFALFKFRAVFYFLVLASILCLSGDQEFRPLQPEQPVERSINGGETHIFEFEVEAGYFARAEVRPKNIETVVSLFSPDGSLLVEMDGRDGRLWIHTVSCIADISGTYRVEIRALETREASGSYLVSLEERRRSRTEDQKQLNAEKYLSLGRKFYEKGGVEHEKAIGNFEKALALWRNLNKPTWEGVTLFNLGWAQLDLAEYQNANDSFTKVVAIFSRLNERKGVGNGHQGLGNLYYLLNETEKAENNFRKALEVRIEEADSFGTANSYVSLGDLMADQNLLDEARSNYSLAISAYRSIGRKRGIGVVLNAQGNLSYRRQQGLVSNTNRRSRLPNPRPIPRPTRRSTYSYYRQALAVFESIDYRPGLARTYHNLGNYYISICCNSGTNGKSDPDARAAIANLSKALLLSRSTNDLRGESLVMQSFMALAMKRDLPRVAAAYGKLSVNGLQVIRGSSISFETGTQKSLLSSVEGSYRTLGELLIELDQYDQAIQVLNLFLDEQFYDFSHNDSEPADKIGLTPAEDGFAEGLKTAIKIAIEIENGVVDRKDPRLPPEKEDRAIPDGADPDTIPAFIKAVDSAEKGLSRRGERAAVPPPIDPGKDTKIALRELSDSTGLRTAALHTLIGKDNFYVLLVSPFEEIKVFSSPIGSTELNQKIVDFYRLLQSSAYDPRPLGEDLYNVIFKPVEAELKRQKIETLMWQLDGALRYIPVAALYDGNQYLVEKYRNTVFTRAISEDTETGVPRDWTVSGFGSSRQETVTLLGDRISFGALPGVRKELDQIIRSKGSEFGILSGESFIDEEFTKEALLSALRQSRPVVHIGSHFSFRPGDAARSFLLMGDGTAFTLSDMKSQKGMFDGVELLTLSACNTAATQPNANGREIDAFAELAQRLGANAVMATLWKVADESTSLLMTEFYRLKKENPKLTKAEAIRLAQQKMLSGTLKASNKWLDERSKKVKTREDREKSPLLKFDPDKPFAHPYYWSPFVLIGNWK